MKNFILDAKKAAYFWQNKIVGVNRHHSCLSLKQINLIDFQKNTNFPQNPENVLSQREVLKDQLKVSPKWPKNRIDNPSKGKWRNYKQLDDNKRDIIGIIKEQD